MVDSQPGLPDAWDAPFIYEDRRYLFYVATTISRLPVGIYGGYGILSAASMPGPAQAITPLVLRQQVTTPTPDEILAVNGSVGDSPTPCSVTCPSKRTSRPAWPRR